MAGGGGGGGGGGSRGKKQEFCYNPPQFQIMVRYQNHINPFYLCIIMLLEYSQRLSTNFLVPFF